MEKPHLNFEYHYPGARLPAKIHEKFLVYDGSYQTAFRSAYTPALRSKIKDYTEDDEFWYASLEEESK